MIIGGAVVQKPGVDRLPCGRKGQVCRGSCIRVGLIEIDHRDLYLQAGVRIAEPQAQFALHGEQAHLLGNVGQEEESDVATDYIRKIGVESAADADRVGGKVQLSDDQELAVGAELQEDLAVENLFGGVDGKHLGPAGDHHRRGEGGEETGGPGKARRLHGLNGVVLPYNLILDFGQPSFRGGLGWHPELPQ